MAVREPVAIRMRSPQLALADAHGVRVDERRLARDELVAGLGQHLDPALLRCGEASPSRRGRARGGREPGRTRRPSSAELVDGVASSAATRYAFVGRHATFGQRLPSGPLDERDARAVLARRLGGRVACCRAGAETMRSKWSVMAGSSQTQPLRYARAVENEAANEAALVARLRAGDEAAFRALIEMYQAMLVRVARMYVSTQAVAEEVAQETWLAVLEGIDRFEGRSSFKTWLFRILTNRAKTRGIREGRSLPFSALEPDEPAVDADRFHGAITWPGHWAATPRAFRRSG